MVSTLRGFELALAPQRMHSGTGSLAHLRQELTRAGAKRAVIVCGRSLARDPQGLATVQAALGDACVGVFDQVQAHSPSDSVMAAAGLLATVQADAVIALGGGSAIVTARAASIVLAEGARPQDLCTRRGADGRLTSPKLLNNKIPILAIPTTPTTATPKAGSAVHDELTGERLALFDPKARARCMFVEPALLALAPVELFRSASLNTLAMAISGLEGDHDNPLAEAFLKHAIHLVAVALPVLWARPDDADARLRLMHAAILCGQGTDLAGGGLVTALSHSLGPVTGAANGLVNAVLVPHGMRFNAVAVPQRYERILGALAPRAAPGTDGTLAEAAIEAVAALLRAVEAPTRLRDLGGERPEFDALAAHALNDWSLQGNPRPVTHADLVGLLAAAW